MGGSYIIFPNINSLENTCVVEAMLKYDKHTLYTKDFSKCAHAALTSSLLLTKLLILTTGESHTSPLSFHFTALLKIIWIEYEQATALEFLLSLLPRTKEKGEELGYAFVSPGVFFQPRALHNKKQAKMFPRGKKKNTQSLEESSTLMRQFLASWFQSAVLAKLQKH